jgi:PAS domain S-box-containing protein
MSDNFDIDRFAAALLRTTPDAVVYADAEGVIRYWNAGAERIFGFVSAEAVGKSLDMIIPQSLRQRHWDGYRKTMATGETRYGAGDLLSVPAVRKDGTRVSIEFTVTPFHDTAGRMLGIAAIMRDVTKQFAEMKALRAESARRTAGA